MPAHRRAIAAVRGEAQNLQRQHREHAGHQIQQQSAEQRQGDRGAQRQRALRGRERQRQRRGRGRRGSCDHRSRKRDVDLHRALVAPESRGRFEDAGNSREFADSLHGNRQRERPARAIARKLLRGARLDLPGAVREEAQLADVRGRGSAGRRRQDQIDDRAPRRGAGAPAADGARKRCARPGDRSTPMRVGWRACAALGRDRQDQGQIRAFGNADFLADQPVGARRQSDRLRIGDLAGIRDIGQQQHLAFVAIVDQRTDRQRLRRRPLYRSSAQRRRELPGEGRRQPGIPGILPIGVPAAIHRQPQCDRQRLARNERCALGHQFRLDVGGPHRSGMHDRGRRSEQNRCNQLDEMSWACHVSVRVGPRRRRPVPDTVQFYQVAPPSAPALASRDGERALRSDRWTCRPPFPRDPAHHGSVARFDPLSLPSAKSATRPSCWP